MRTPDQVEAPVYRLRPRGANRPRWGDNLTAEAATAAALVSPRQSAPDPEVVEARIQIAVVRDPFEAGLSEFLKSLELQTISDALRRAEAQAGVVDLEVSGAGRDMDRSAQVLGLAVDQDLL